MSLYDDDTALEPIGDHRWKGHVDPQWNIGDNPNGGYLVSLVTTALQGLGPHQDPLSITTHYLRPGTPGTACEVEVEVVRTGRTLSTYRARLVQEGKARLDVIAAFGDLSLPSAAGAVISIESPAMVEPEACVQRSGAAQGVELPLLSRLDTRIHPDHAAGGTVDSAELLGWIRFTDDRPPDSRSLVLFADAFPPSVFSLLGNIGWVPTVELTVHVRRRPAPGWILGRFETSDLTDGRMIENGMLWDSTGTLVAQSRQIGLLLGN
jgi:acyl-CoA thioesterase